MSSVLKRVARPWPARAACFVSLAHGLIHENGTLFLRWDSDTNEIAPLSYVLALVTDEDWQCQIIYVVGGWNTASLPTTEWFIAPDGWQRVVYHRDPLIAIYKAADGRKVTIYSTSQWFGDCNNAYVCRQAYVRLRELLRSTFDPGADLLGTPSRTGLDLLARSLPRNRDGIPYEYPVLDTAFREILEHNVGQGRMEFLPPVADTLPSTRLYVVDANWMYAACIRHLPTPPLQHDDVAEFAGYRTGFYHVRFQVPEGWQHIGLLPTWDREAGKTWYPCEPDLRRYEALVSGEELRLAYEHGWHVEIIERWLFADDRLANADPSRAWSEHLRMLRGACTDAREGKIAPYVRSALRALCIKAIGGLHRRGRTEQVETPHDKAEEVDPSMVLEVTPTVIRWERPIALASEMSAFNHPEWSAMVWCRARARLARTALQLPRESIVALRNDAIVTTFDPGWKDDGQPGTFRVKGCIDLAGQGVPQDERTYRRLLKGVEHA